MVVINRFARTSKTKKPTRIWSRSTRRRFSDEGVSLNQSGQGSPTKKIKATTLLEMLVTHLKPEVCETLPMEVRTRLLQAKQQGVVNVANENGHETNAQTQTAA